jgi:hypothetical protein
MFQRAYVQESDLSVDISRVSSQQLTHQVSGPLPPPGMPSHRFRASGDGSRGNGVILDVPVGSSDVEAQRTFSFGRSVHLTLCSTICVLDKCHSAVSHPGVDQRTVPSEFDMPCP